MRNSILFTIICLILASCGFGHLTDINNQDTSAPTAEDCGGCHVEQYTEWQQTRHAIAFSSDEFKRQSDHYNDEDCLFCHVPGDVQNPAREPRNYNRTEGITCVSCHLHDQAMQGPHDSGALISPHAITKNSTVNSKMDSEKLCGICHQETYEQWQEQQKIVATPTCHGCHGAPIKRTHTKGTNLFSDILVAFESEHEVRSHHLMLPGQDNPELAPKLTLGQDKQNQVTFTLLNSLPHDLPTGSFGEKQIIVSVRRLKGAGVLATKDIALPAPLSPGEQITLTIALAEGEQSSHLQFRLLRQHGATEETTLIRSYHFQEDAYVTTP